jgi:hypothetical protein
MIPGHISYSVSLKSILKLTSHLCNCSFLPNFVLKLCRHFSPMHPTWPVHLIFLCLIILIFGKEYRVCSSLCNFFIPLRNTYSPQQPILRCPLNVGDHISHPYKTTRIITVVLCMFLQIWRVTVNIFGGGGDHGHTRRGSLSALILGLELPVPHHKKQHKKVK